MNARKEFLLNPVRKESYGEIEKENPDILLLCPHDADSEKFLEAYPELLEEIKEFIDLQILGINSTSEWLDYVDYTNLSSKAIKYKENNEIVDEYSLSEMQRAFLDGQFPHKIKEK